jgi:hypothetical protein
LKETEFLRLAGAVTGTQSKGEKCAADYEFSEKKIYGYTTMNHPADNP